MTFRDRIHPQLRDWYDASPGFDFDHLETFVPQCNQAELQNLKEDPLVEAHDRTIPAPDGAPGGEDPGLPAQGAGRAAPALPLLLSRGAGSSSAPSTGRRPCASGM